MPCFHLSLYFHVDRGIVFKLIKKLHNLVYSEMPYWQVVGKISVPNHLKNLMEILVLILIDTICFKIPFIFE